MGGESFRRFKLTHRKTIGITHLDAFNPKIRESTTILVSELKDGTDRGFHRGCGHVTFKR